jgi:hypothetical protein
MINKKTDFHPFNKIFRLLSGSRIERERRLINLDED